MTCSPYLVGVGEEETCVTEISYSISVHVVLVQVINKCTVVLRPIGREGGRGEEWDNYADKK